MASTPDRCKETTNTTGTGTLTLAGVVAGPYQAFSAGLANGETCEYCIVQGSLWEVGVGTFTTASNTLSRDTVYSGSSGAGSKITLAAGGATVFTTIPGRFQNQPTKTTSVVQFDGVGVGVAGASGAITLNSSGNRTLINENGLGLGGGAPTTAIRMYAVGQQFRLENSDDTATTSPQFYFNRARGSLGSSTGVVSGDTLGHLGGNGHNSSAMTVNGRAGIRFFAAETWSTTATGTSIGFYTTVNGTVTPIQMALMSNTGRFGVGTNITPNTKVDVDGDFALRRANLALVNGANDDIAIGERSFIRITGPTGAFSISSIASPADGKLLVIQNTTTQAMTITNAAGTGTAANRILTQSGADMVTTGVGVFLLIYSSPDSRWIVLSANL